jgi:hypothetical protein
MSNSPNPGLRQQTGRHRRHQEPRTRLHPLRHPESIGLGGVVRPSAGLKDAPSYNSSHYLYQPGVAGAAAGRSNIRTRCRCPVYPWF